VTKRPKLGFQPSIQKLPQIAKPVDTSKSPRTVVSGEYHHLHPSWRVSLLRMMTPYGWHEVPSEKVREIREKLSSFESMSWGEILTRSNGKHHEVAVGRIDSGARLCLDETRQGDVDSLVSLRLTGKERIWGILELGVLKVLWWDPDHSICPSQKSHT
jgi:hypothetical protein